MATALQLSITLPVDMAQMVRAKVASGGFASEIDVIREGLAALQERDMAVELWLRETAAPAYDAHQANPGQASPLPQTAKRLDAFMRAEEQKRG